MVNAVTDRYRPLSFDQEKLTGLLAKRMRANSEGYLEHVDDFTFVPSAKGLAGAQEAGFVQQPGRVLEAIANAYQYHRDEHLRIVMQRVEKLVIASQAADHATENQLLAHKYELLGLIAYYRLTGDETALVAAKKIADLLLRSFPHDSGRHSRYRGATPLIEPLVALYSFTEENRYLELARSAADAWLQDSETHGDPSLENLSALQGLVDLYRITGDESYFRPIPSAWLEVRNRWLSLTGSPMSNGEGFPAGESNSAGDACATLSWIQLTLNLLRVTGETQYAEQLEHTIYNQLFAGQDANTGAVLMPAPLDGSKERAPASDACLSSEAQGVALIPSAVWGSYGNGIAVLMYNAGRATFQLSHRRGTVQLYSEATFTESGDMWLHVEPVHNIRFPLRLRVPEWTSHFTVDIQGSHLIGKPGDYLTINREWKRGDTVKISMDMTVRVINGSPTAADQIALQRGPQVLALARAFNPQLKDLADAAITAADASQPKLVPAAAKLPSNWTGDQAYAVAGEYQGRPQDLILVPFADAKHYRVWLRRPSASSGATD